VKAVPTGSKTILLYGLDPTLERELSSVLRNFSVRTSHADELDSVDGADLIFCSAVGAQLRSVLEMARSKGDSPAPPVVVVSRLPEVSRWLDAMEAGANDYCAAPFELKQLGWILKSNLPSFEMTLA
jgi:DNA-binding response OmpR family regulator